MSATFDIIVLCKNIIPVDVLYNKLCQNQFEILIDSIEVIDNWEYENQVKLNLDIDLKTLTNYVENNKIIMISGLLNDNHRCGLFMCKVSDNIITLDVWISSKNLPFLDDDYITEETLSIYEAATNSVIKMNDEYDIYLCGIGVEAYFTYGESIDCIIGASQNINRWVIPSAQQFQRFKGFDEIEKNGFKIISRTAN